MAFVVMFEQPYLVANGKAYPVDIDGACVTYFEEGAVDYDSPGTMSIEEVWAKFGRYVKHKSERKSRKKEK